MRTDWAITLAMATSLALARVFADLAVPPTMQWWLTPTVAFTASLLTSAGWILARRRSRPPGREGT